MGSALCIVLKAVISANGSFAGDIQIPATPFSLQIFSPLLAHPRGEDKGSSLRSPSKATLVGGAHPAPRVQGLSRLQTHGLDVCKGKAQSSC